MPSLDISRTLDTKIEIAWNGSSFIDETAYLLSVRGTLELVPPTEVLQGGKQVIQKATLVLNNTTGRFSPYNTGGALHDYLTLPAYYRKPFRLSVKENGGAWQRIFTGFLKFPVENFMGSTVSFQVTDLGEMLRKRYSTAMLTNYLEHDLVIHYLSNVAGLVDGTHFVSPDWAVAHPGTPATIARSNTTIDFSWLDDEPIWDELVDVGQASGGRCYINKDGLVCFDKGWSWFLDLTPTEWLSISNFSEVKPEFLDREFFDEIIVEYSSRVVTGNAEVYALDKSFIVYPGATEKLEMRFQNPIYSLEALTAGVDYFFYTASNENVSSSVTAPVKEVYTQKAVLTITNNLSQLIYIPPFKLNGMALAGGPANQVTKVLSPAVDSGKRLEIRGNPYIQTKAQAQSLADFLSWWYSKPKSSYSVSKLRGLASRTLGRRVTMADHYEGDSGLFEAQGIITRIDFTVQVNPDTGAIRYEHNLTLIEDIFMSATESWFIIGTTSWGNTGALLWL